MKANSRGIIESERLISLTFTSQRDCIQYVFAWPNHNEKCKKKKKCNHFLKRRYFKIVALSNVQHLNIKQCRKEKTANVSKEYVEIKRQHH